MVLCGFWYGESGMHTMHIVYHIVSSLLYVFRFTGIRIGGEE